ncbi:MAG: response regulator [Deltaproteobacteria bacterium]|nr:MAG: response regulator [Deltaproteobacteria bacterium]
MPEPVLVVEDDPDVREVMIAVVENEGHTAVPAENGAEALQLLRNGLNPCVILLDLMMPVKNGWEFRAEQNADPHLAAIPTIIVSAAGKEAMRDLHPDGTVPKPIDLDKLTKLLKTHCIHNHRFA